MTIYVLPTRLANEESRSPPMGLAGGVAGGGPTVAGVPVLPVVLPAVLPPVLWGVMAGMSSSPRPPSTERGGGELDPSRTRRDGHHIQA